MNYTLNSIKINSAWFDDLGRKQNVYQKITYKGLNLYFQLYKFRLYRQENEHTFITSISLLRKETGYKTDEVFDLLRKMKNAKIIKIENVSRWDYLLDDEGKIKDKDILVITATDTFPIEDFKKEVGKYFIFVPLDLFQMYEDKGLNERYYALYCLIKKWSQNVEQKAWMSIAKMAKFLGFDKDYVNQMIYNMNRNYFLSSYKKSNGKGGYLYNHYILDSWKPEEIESFLNKHKANMDKLIKRVDKKKNSKKKMDTENEMETVDEGEELPEQPNEMKPVSFDTMPISEIKQSYTQSWNKIDEYEDELEAIFG